MVFMDRCYKALFLWSLWLDVTKPYLGRNRSDVYIFILILWNDFPQMQGIGINLCKYNLGFYSVLNPTKVIISNLNFTRLGLIRKFRPKRFQKIDSRC
jgi:hypothetical protein